MNQKTYEKQTPEQKLKMYLEARRPIIYICHFDYQSVDKLIEKVCCSHIGCDPEKTEIGNYIIEEYSAAGGRIDFRTKSAKDREIRTLGEYLALFNSSQFEKDPHRYLVVLKEVHHLLDNPQVYSTLQTIAQRVKKSDESDKNETHQNYNVTIIIVDSKLVIPQELEKLITLVEIEPPDDDAIGKTITNMAELNYVSVSDEIIEKLKTSLRGLSEFEIKQTLNLAIVNAVNSGERKLDSRCFNLINDEKRQAIQKSRLIEMAEVGDEESGALRGLNRYIQENKLIFSNPEYALKYNVKLPTGVMIVGMPGCGKSLSAKCIAKEFGVPLLRLDVGRLMGKYVGESEENMRRAIAVAEVSAPCVLWIDEIEKAFAGIGSSGGGGEVTTRMFGYFLTWMQEKKTPIYVVATANDITNLPPEFLRRGRFDEVFKVVFPDQKGCKEILTLHIRQKCKKLPNDINPAILAMRMFAKTEERYSGADIASIVNEALKNVLVENIRSGKPESLWRELSQKDMVEVIDQTKSSYRSQKTKLDEMLKKLDDLDIKSAT